MPVNRLFFVSSWMIDHYRKRAQEKGTYHVAKQLRKQGIPLSIAVLILA